MGIAKCMMAGAFLLAGVSAGAIAAQAEDVTLTLWSLDRDIQPAPNLIKEFNARNGRSVAGLSDRAMQMIERYDWPGNVRELRNVMERATIVAKGAVIEVADLPPLAAPVAPSASGAGVGLAPGTTVDQAEQQLIEVTLQHTGGNKTRAAEMLGISLKTLHNKLNRMKERPD